MAFAQINLRLDPELLARIDERRTALGVSRNAWIEKALRHVVENAKPLPEKRPDL